jgi:hypothetical protein
LEENTTFYVKELNAELTGDAGKINIKVHRRGWIAGLTDLMAFHCLAANEIQMVDEV